MSRASRSRPRKSRKSPVPKAQAKPGLGQLEKRAKQAPLDPANWKALGKHWLNLKRWDQARQPIERALELVPRDSECLEMLARVLGNQGDDAGAVTLLERALDIDPDFVQAHFYLSELVYGRGQLQKALAHIDQALAIQPGNVLMLSHRGLVLYKLLRYEEAIEVFDYLIDNRPDHYSHWNNAANIRRDLGLLDEADHFYRQSIERAGNDALPYSNRLTALHYNPHVSRDSIFDLCREWEKHYGPGQLPSWPQRANDAPDRQLRIGMISDGFRLHPVGKMITAALKQLPRHQIALYAYSTTNTVDVLTMRIREVSTQWMTVPHLSDEALAQQIVDDQIDILFDLAGHNAGTRMRVMAMKPAPLLIKWVGGLINTSGLSAVDYLLTDSIESPQGEDDYYTEKLIRLPDDYICYAPPDKCSEVQALPALDNGYITLGCFNNPSKVNEVILSEWASILHQLPHSRLFLKGFQYNSEGLCQRIRDIMASQGIPAARLIIEGPSPHRELLEAYNRVDIALDPWPYSGGLTTCEALLMGVPVVTMPGPTFAGRHSATHLVNAGMPELVTASWDEYRERVIELAGDLQSLSTIRAHLRDILLQSPVCDGPRFARHFNTAMRAIWQRHCEDNAPAALTLDQEGSAQFENEAEPVKILHPAPPPEDEETGFSWEFQGKVIAVDNGAQLLEKGVIHQMLQLNTFELICFDPTSKALNNPRREQKGVHYYPNALLGNGEEATFHACLDPALNATLTPLQTAAGAQVLTRLPVGSLQLDSIEGLPSVDWLVLDAMNDSAAVLEHGSQALKDTLLIEAKVSFQPTHECQPNLAELSRWASRHGFRFYRLHEPQHCTQLPKRGDLTLRQATELASADALFIPDSDRMEALGSDQLVKLAFVLHTAYGIQDLTYKLLSQVGEKEAESYLQAQGLITPHAPEASTTAGETQVDPATRGNESTTASQPRAFAIPDQPFMSNSEAALFLKSLRQASQYFEFGSGGSTVWAVKEGLTVYGVESDVKWVRALQAKLGEHCKISTVDIGPTREWGHPVAESRRDNFPLYSRAIDNYKTAFDLILVDGRFRVACTLSAIKHILTHNSNPKTARIFIHDFWDRPAYRVVLHFLESIEAAERASVFRIKPDIDLEQLERIWEQYAYQPA